MENFRGIPQLFGRDFNVTLEAANRLNDFGGRDPRSEQFWASMAADGLQDMGSSDCFYKWRNSAHPHLSSRQIRELLEEFPEAHVHAVLRPLFDYIPIKQQREEGTCKPTYFKLDRSTLLGDRFKKAMAEWWVTH